MIYTQTILAIMIFRDCNSNILNDFNRFIESKTWNCVLYGEFYGGKMCPGTQRKSRIKVSTSVKNVFIIDVLWRFSTRYLSFTMEIFHKSIEFIIRNERKLLFHEIKLGTFCKITQNCTFFHITKNLIQMVLNMYLI